jgi:hypothetical protein
MASRSTWLLDLSSSTSAPSVVKALFVTHASHMVTSLMANVRLLGN